MAKRKPNVGVVSYGSRGAALADGFERGGAKLYIASKQANPMNIAIAERTGGKHIVANLSDVDGLSDFFFGSGVDFVFVGPEAPIIAGIHDRLDERGIPALCPTQEYALEGSKVRQRQILSRVYPDANPPFKVFNRESEESDVKDWLKELDYHVAIKPDTPTAGKGVGVAEDHFEPTEKGAFPYFQEVLAGCERVIIEGKVDGEESSHIVLCNGSSLLPFPDTRDYKRAFTDDRGPNTGGMGSYCDAKPWLPFMTYEDREREMEITGALFKAMKGSKNVNKALWGVPFYMAFIHTADGSKVLEVNSRFGDPEAMNLIPLVENNLVDLCMQMIHEPGSSHLKLAPKASVVWYLVPPAYGGKEPKNPDRMAVDMGAAMRMAEDSPDKYRVYPGDMALEDGVTYAIKSRAVACIGIGDTIEEARYRAREVIGAVKSPDLWYRTDVASAEHIGASVAHMKRVRGE